FLEFLAKEPAASLVDLGCGNGQLLAEIRARFPGTSLCWIDLSSPQIEDNRLRDPAIRWHDADLDRPRAITGALSGTFEVVVASEVIEHVEHPELLLKNAIELSMPGRGRLLLSTQSGALRETERRVGHLRHFTVSSMDRLLRDAGWEPERVWNAGFPFHDLSKWYANRDPDASMRRFGDEPYGLREVFVCAALRAAFRFNSRRRGAQLFAVARRAR
ncbi:MAG: class I SAM-dependent methyltransferase, partial [Polyangiaceae bacterium]